MKRPELLLALFLLQGCLTTTLGQEVASGQDARPARLDGFVSTQVSAYDVTGIAPRMNPVSAYLYGDIRLSAGKDFSIPLSFVLSTDSREFRQPFNVAGLSPTWRWATLHLGYRNLYFSPFTLAGHGFLGGGLGLYPGKFRFEAIYGRFQRPVPADTVVLVDNHTLFATPAYERWGYAAKIGVGSPRNFVDLIFLNAWDKAASPPQELPGNVETTPAENAVAGISSKLSFGKKWTWNNDLGLSVYTRDRRAEAIAAGDDNWPAKLAGQLLTVNLSTYSAFAGESAVKYAARDFSFQLKYRRVEPDYRSMGAYYFLTDQESLTAAPAWRLWKRKVRLALRGGFQRDNLRDLKRARALRTIGSASVSVQPSPRFGLNVQYANFGYERQIPSAVAADTIQLRQVNHSASIAPRLTFIRPGAVHSVFALASFQALDNGSSNLPGAQDFQAWFGNLVYVLNLRSNGLSLTGGLHVQKSKLAQFDTGIWGAQAGVGKNWPALKINAGLNLVYSRNHFNGDANGSTVNANAHFNYQLTPRHALRAAFFFLKNAPEQTGFSQEFHEFRGQIGYDYRF